MGFFWGVDQGGSGIAKKNFFFVLFLIQKPLNHRLTVAPTFAIDRAWPT